MRVFGGGDEDRNRAFDRAFTSIRGRMGNDRFLVAGFTEVMNCNATRPALTELALALDMSLNPPTLFAVGTTSVGDQTEWVGISTRNRFDVAISGKVLRRAFDLTWRAYPTTTVPAEMMPDDNYSRDVRGLAYVGGTWRGQTCLFGFTHNILTVNEPTVTFRSLPYMVNAIRQAHPAFDWGDRLYIGGDFNVPPDDVGDLRLVHGRISASRGDIPTTTANAYDFWLTTDRTRGTWNARVFTQSRWDVAEEYSAGLSDHAGVGLRIT